MKSKKESRVLWSDIEILVEAKFGSNDLFYQAATYARAIFSPGELEDVNASYAFQVEKGSDGLLARNQILNAIQGIKVFEAISEKQVQYAIQQIGLVERESISLEDFMEVSICILT